MAKICAYPPCKRAVTSTHAATRYCSERCSDNEKKRVRRERRKAAGLPVLERLDNEHRAVPKAARPPKQEVLAKPCEGCRYVVPQPASWRGVECRMGLYTACNPLGPLGPRLKEAI